jgi:transcriptional regulator with XRE-family HTH domain
MLLDELGNRIREQRKKLGLKQEDIARALQVSPQAVSKWERGENAPDIATLGPLSRLLGVSIDQLLGNNLADTDIFDATVFASSVRGAYKKSLEMDPRSYATWANALYYQLTEAVLRHDGVPIKYMGDEFLCFFSGAHHRERALKAAHLARTMSNDPLVIGLSSGDIYLGALGHPEYARPDIVGETVNVAFLTLNWADEHAKSGLVATAALFPGVGPAKGEIAQKTEVTFKGIPVPVVLYELKAAGAAKD